MPTADTIAREDTAALLLKQLIDRPSVTPEDAGCLDLLGQRLAKLGFALERLDAGPDDARVSNLWATRAGASADAPTLAFAGHVDVVPPGPLAQWTSPPFDATVREGRLFGRGASDMKGSVAAFVVALERFLAAEPSPGLRLAMLLTSDEEGPALYGTTHVVETLRQRGERLDFCIVGEPSATVHTGDTIKTGRRGSLSARLIIKGIQGHIAYPQLARNPVHQAAPALAELVATVWDEGNAHFPPTSFQISNINAGTGASNVIPAEAVIDFNFRFSTASNEADLRARVERILEQHQLDFEISWTLGGQPFLTRPGTLLEVVRKAILETTALEPELSTSGGTSDGRFIATLCPQVLELGPPNESIHKIDENIVLAELDAITRVYVAVLHGMQRQTAPGA